MDTKVGNLNFIYVFISVHLGGVFLIAQEISWHLYSGLNYLDGVGLSFHQVNRCSGQMQRVFWVVSRIFEDSKCILQGCCIRNNVMICGGMAHAYFCGPSQWWPLHSMILLNECYWYTMNFPRKTCISPIQGELRLSSNSCNRCWPFFSHISWLKFHSVLGSGRSKLLLCIHGSAANNLCAFGRYHYWYAFALAIIEPRPDLVAG